ncbi:hypothetical protein OE88DRAFT_1739891 [Heliocybe sulcata]|uniref:Uncharacterized protein n=1 Tax=Heliocybe sulcata TaxID=5364 RepID=A0A5C3MKL7_9AGAM|nr:hypothetical protein OE88DRAFT_1739891 [Heliocybe sulcata]
MSTKHKSGVGNAKVAEKKQSVEGKGKEPVRKRVDGQEGKAEPVRPRIAKPVEARTVRTIKDTRSSARGTTAGAVSSSKDASGQAGDGKQPQAGVNDASNRSRPILEDQPDDTVPPIHEADVRASARPVSNDNGGRAPSVVAAKELIVPAPSEDYSGNIFDESSDSEDAGASEEMEDEADITVLLTHSPSASETPEAGDPESESEGDVRPSSMSRQLQSTRRSASPVDAEPRSPRGYSRIYPDIANLHSSHPGSKPELPSQAMPGAFAVPSPEAKQKPTSQRLPASNPSVRSSGVRQEPTPPVSGPASPVASETSLQFTPSLLRSQQRAPVDVNLSSQATPVFRRRKRSRTPEILPYTHGDEEENIFESVPPTPARGAVQHKERHREPPKLVEGPFSRVFTDAQGRARFSRNGKRASGVDDEDEDGGDENWPPVRGASLRSKKEKQESRKVDKGKGKAREVDAGEGGDAGGLHHPFSQVVPEEGNGYRRRREVRSGVQEMVAAMLKSPFTPAGPSHGSLGEARESRPEATPMPPIIDSSSEPANLKTPAKTPARRSSMQRFIEGYIRGEQASMRTPSADAFAGPSSFRRVDFSVAQDPDTTTEAAGDYHSSPAQPSVVGSVEQNPFAPSADESSEDEADDKAMQGTVPESISTLGVQMNEGYLKDNRRRTLPARVLRPEPVNSTSARPIPERRRGYSMPGPRMPPLRYSSRNTSAATTARISPPPPPSPEHPSDQHLAMQLGTNLLLDGMAQNHGFQKQVVYEVFEATKDFEETDGILRDMRRAAQQMAMKRLSGRYVLASDAASTSGSADELSEEDDGMVDVRDEGVGAAPPHGPRSVSQDRGRPSALHWVPADSEGNEYRPPRTSRAAEYTRLANAGREKEARRRERRKSTLGGLSPRKVRKLRETDTAVSAREKAPVDEPSRVDDGPVIDLRDRSRSEIKRGASDLNGEHSVVHPSLTGAGHTDRAVRGPVGKGQARKRTAALYSAYI